MAQGRANYFYCVRITNPKVHEAIEEALDWILDKDPQYTDFCYTSEMLHVTLCEVCLKTDEDISRASAALKNVEDEVRASLPQSELRLKGITTFREQVMVADVEYEKDFEQFAKRFKDRIKQAGVTVVENHDFRPHMTIMKISSMRAKKAKVEKINPWLFVNLKEKLFGAQPVNSIHLCKMGYDRRPDGFYQTPAEILFRH